MLKDLKFWKNMLGRARHKEINEVFERVEVALKETNKNSIAICTACMNKKL